MHPRKKLGCIFGFSGCISENAWCIFGRDWCIWGFVVHFASLYTYYGPIIISPAAWGFENGDHPKNCRQNNDNRITVSLEQFVVVEVP